MLTKCFDTVLAGEFDAGMLILDYPNADPLGTADCDRAVRSVIEAARRNGKQPIVTTTLPGDDAASLAGEDGRGRLSAACRAWRAPSMPSPRGVRFARLKKKILAERRGRRVARCRAGAGDHAAVLGVGREAGAWQARPDRAGGRACDAGGSGASRRVAIGFPVVAKLAKPVLAHKTEAGAVALNIGDGAALMAAIVRMTKSVARLSSPASRPSNS